MTLAGDESDLFRRCGIEFNWVKTTTRLNTFESGFPASCKSLMFSLLCFIQLSRYEEIFHLDTAKGPCFPVDFPCFCSPSRRPTPELYRIACEVKRGREGKLSVQPRGNRVATAYAGTLTDPGRGAGLTHFWLEECECVALDTYSENGSLPPRPNSEKNLIRFEL